ncbi:acetylxylan esterase [Methylicorpusculum sp.]|uniref:acetylxylan esterase n=1 Tax=Methylicorpusculum sp. TaxID=2713644 RepID=UPI0027256E03|nr:acetylxylan esterase [Methylicorpusculum sp.]MDO8842957.1 acetylxylan esterase [Methylicorpusculum sp.]
MSDFDPTYGYTLDQLLRIEPPTPPEDFTAFWQSRYQRAVQIKPNARITLENTSHDDFECYDLKYRSTDAVEIGGWALIPKHSKVRRGIIVGHGYGGRDEPDFNLPVSGAAFLFPCFRGMSKSRCETISDDPSVHVLHNIDDRDRYVLGGCVEDLWLAVSALLELFPSVAGHVAYLGISFGGGIGALALPWDARIQRAHFNVPSFGNNPLRLQLPTWGSAAAVQNYQQQYGPILATLNYYDAAISARHIQVPVYIAAALADPAVAPPGQFSIYNALSGEKKLFVLDRGHSEYLGQAEQERDLLSELQAFFSEL